MEHAEISRHEVEVYTCVAAAQRWLTNADIHLQTGIAPRTVRQHTKHLVAEGIFDQAEVFPRHAFRVAATAAQRNKAYLLRLSKAQEVFASLAQA